MKKTEHLFVYGTLAPGKVNHHEIEPISGSWQPAYIKGFLYDEGWGSEEGCPGVVPDENGEIVNGLLFSSDKLDAHWQRLDEFEGEEYDRIPVNVMLESGENIFAQVYAISSKIKLPR